MNHLQMSFQQNELPPFSPSWYMRCHLIYVDFFVENKSGSKVTCHKRVSNLFPQFVPQNYRLFYNVRLF